MSLAEVAAMVAISLATLYAIHLYHGTNTTPGTRPGTGHTPLLPKLRPITIEDEADIVEMHVAFGLQYPSDLIYTFPC